MSSNLRRTIELGLRGVALAALTWLVWRTARPPADAHATRSAASGAALPAALARWSSFEDAESLHVSFDTLPSARTRDWLLALRRSGRSVGWDGRALPPIAVAAEPEARPRGGARVLAAAPAAASVSVGDAAGTLDSLRVAPAGGRGVVLASARLAEAAVATVSGSRARAPIPDQARAGRVLVLGAAGWEAKFVIAALEEDGWQVDARLRVSPTVEVSQGGSATPDTARHAAAVVLDSAAAIANATALVRFVRQGGGVVVAGDAARVAALRDIAPAGAAGTAVAGVAGAFDTDSARRALTLLPLERLARDAIVLERRGALVAAAARRVGAGRAAQVGYTDTWRWRMLGAGDAPARHRDWWSRVVASAAYLSAGPSRPAPDSLTAAPYAALVAALGPPVAAPPPAPAIPDARLSWWWFALVAGALLAEWASRRMRGAR